MTADRPPETPLVLPPTDHVARVLLKRGARDHALAFLNASIARDPQEKACAALLRAVEARPDASVYGPDLSLDVSIVDAYARRGMFIEALAVVRGLGLDATTHGGAVAEKLELLLAPLSEDAMPQLVEVDASIRSGAASVALTALDAWSRSGEALPDEARRRHEVLSHFLIDQATDAVPAEQSVQRGDGGELGNLIADAVRGRDLPSAMAAAEDYGRRHPEDPTALIVISSLQRVVDAMVALSLDAQTDNLSTQPLTGHNVALFQLRMGNIDVSERLFRKQVLANPGDRVARKHLDDIQILRAAMEGKPVAGTPRQAVTVDPLSQTLSRPAEAARIVADVLAHVTPMTEEETRQVSNEELERIHNVFDEVTKPTPADLKPVDEFQEQTRQVEVKVPRKARRIPTSPELLKKNQRLPTSQEGYAAIRPADPSDWEEDVSTEIGTPEKQAELLIEQGYTEQALGIYDRMSALFPDRPKYAQRAEELRQLVAKANPLPPERSVEIDISAIEGPTLAVEDARLAFEAPTALVQYPLDPPLGVESPPAAQRPETDLAETRPRPETDLAETRPRPSTDLAETRPESSEPAPTAEPLGPSPSEPPPAPDPAFMPPRIEGVHPPISTDVEDGWDGDDHTVVTDAPEMSLDELAPPPAPDARGPAGRVAVDASGAVTVRKIIIVGS